MLRIFTSCVIIAMIIGCSAPRNYFYDGRGEKIAKKVETSLKGFDPSQTKVFEEKDSHSKDTKDFHRA